MANKTLNTRIQLKNASLSDWNSSNLKLLAGEIALAAVNTTRPDGQGGHINVPTYLMKVGDGQKTFSQLNWLAAPASDVHEWAKKETLQYADLPATLQTEIDNLQAAVGSGGSVDTKINAAISALKEACTVADTAVTKQFVTAVAQDDGKIAVTRRALTADDIPALAISKITGLQDALDLKATVAEVQTLREKVQGTDGTGGLVKAIADEETARKAADKTLTDAVALINNTTIPNLQTNLTKEIDAAKSAASIADGKAVQAQNEVDALETVVTNLTTTVANNKSAAETAVSNEASTRQAEDKKLSDAIDQLKTDIGNLENVMNFRGAVEALPAVAGYQDGDVVVVTAGDNKGKEYVLSDGAWVEFGNTDANSAAISALQGRMTTAEADIDALESSRATKTELATEKKALQDQIDTKAAQTALDSTNSRVTNLETSVGTSDSAGLRKRVKDLESSVGTADTAGLRKRVADLETASATHATQNALETVESTLTKSISDEATARANADTQLQNQITTLKDTTIPGVVSRVAENEKDIAALETAVNTINNTTIPTLATNKDLNDAKARIKAIEDDYLMAADQFIINCGNHTSNNWEF